VEATDRLHVTRPTIAVDVGRVVNVDGVRNQIEGGAIQATSWSLLEQVRFDRHSITSTDWARCPGPYAAVHA
jgi:nicotinate dehydrogenase subunit B